MKYYTGIGSQTITEEESVLITSIGEVMARKGYILKSGAARGADEAFQLGACNVNPSMTDILLPWGSFKDRLQSSFEGINYRVPTAGEFRVAREYLVAECIIPWFDSMKPANKKFHGRNYYQVMGMVNTSVVIYCANEANSEVSGGTRTAVMIARELGIPTYNLRIKKERDKLRSLLGL